MLQKIDRIGEFLLSEGIITEEQLSRAVEEQAERGESLGKLLLSKGTISRDDLNRATAAVHGIEFVELRTDEVDESVVHLVPERFVQQYRAIPVKREGDRLFVAMDSPLNLAARDEIALLTGYVVVPLVTTQKALSLVIQHHFNIESATKQEIVNIRMQEIQDSRTKVDVEFFEEAPRGEEGAVIRLVDSVIKGAIDAGASDIHLEPYEPEMRLRYRVDGILNDIMTIPRNVEPALVSRIKVITDLDISERRVPQDGHFSMTRSGKDYDFRVSTMPTVIGEKVVIRVLDKSTAMVDLDGLGLETEDRRGFESLITRPHGIVLITGPTGSGKTTTLYASLRSLNKGTSNMVTVEDPVEYCLSGINQVQVNVAAGITFPRALRTFLRQDPDVIMVGEIRDQETAELAVDAALTGHMVFSTLHTNDAAGATARLIDMGVEPFLIASSLLGVVAQRLVRSICPDCREAYSASDAERAELDVSGATDGLPMDDLRLYRGTGCHYCYQTGYRGRSGVFEILQISESLRSSIADKRSSAVIRSTATAEGFKTLYRRGIEKVLSGRTTLEEVKRVIGSEVT